MDKVKNMRFFQKPKELQVVQHINKLRSDQLDQLNLVHFGYISSKMYWSKVKYLFKPYPFVEFTKALETKGQPLQFATYRCFGNLASAVAQLKLGQKLYTRCIAINEGNEKWFLVLEISPADLHSDFPIKYKDLILPNKLNRLSSNKTPLPKN